MSLVRRLQQIKTFYAFHRHIIVFFFEKNNSFEFTFRLSSEKLKFDNFTYKRQTQTAKATVHLFRIMYIILKYRLVFRNVTTHLPTGTHNTERTYLYLSLSPNEFVFLNSVSLIRFLSFFGDI